MIESSVLYMANMTPPVSGNCWKTVNSVGALLESSGVKVMVNFPASLGQKSVALY